MIMFMCMFISLDQQDNKDIFKESKLMKKINSYITNKNNVPTMNIFE